MRAHGTRLGNETLGVGVCVVFREIGVRVEKVFTTVNTVYCVRPLVRVARQVLSVIARRPSALSPCSHAVHALDLFFSVC